MILSSCGRWKVSRVHRKTAAELKSCAFYRGSHEIFDGWYNIEDHTVCPTKWEWFEVSSAIFGWTEFESNRLHLNPILPVFTCFRNLVLKRPSPTLIVTILCIEFAVCTLIQLMFSVWTSFCKTFNCDSLFVASTPCLIGLSSIFPNLIELTWVGLFLHENEFLLDSCFFCCTLFRQSTG